MARRSQIAVVATAEDEVTGALKAASRAMSDAAKSVTKSDKELAASSDVVARAMKARLPVSKQVEFAMARERAAGDATARRLVDLRERHLRLSAEMVRFVRRGEEVPAVLLAEARAAEEATRAIEGQRKAAASAAAQSKRTARPSGDGGPGPVGLAAGLRGAAGAATAVVGAATAVVGAAAAAGAGLFALASQASATGDAIFVLGDKLGVGAESLSRLSFAAKQNGATQQDLAVALQALSNRAIRAPQEFEKIGVSVRDAGGQIKAVDVLFRDVAEAISRLPPGAQRVAAAQALMEESGRKLVPVLQLGARGLDTLGVQADRLGVTLSQDSVVAANAFGNELQAVRDAMTATAYHVGSIFVPAFTTAFKVVQGEAGSLNSALSDSFVDTRQAVTGAAADIAAVAARIAAVAERIAWAFSVWIDVAQTIARVNVRALETFQRFTRGLDVLTPGLYKAARTASFFASALGDSEPEADGAAASLQRLSVALRASADAQAKARSEWWSEGEIARNAADWSLLAIGVQTYTPAIDKASKKTKASAAATKAAAQTTGELADAHVKAMEAATDLSDFEAADAARRAADAKAMADAERAETAARAEADRQAEAARTEAIRAAAAERVRIAEEAARREQAVAQRLEGSLLGAYESAKQGPKAFADYALRELERIAVSSVLRLVARALASAFTGGVGGALLGVLGFADGGVVPQRFASGGRVTGGTPGKDSVPALLMPGELVVPRDVASTLPQSFVDALLGRRSMPRMAAGGAVGSPAVAAPTAAPVYVSLNVATPAPPSGAAVERMVRDSLPRALASLNSAGFRLPGTQRIRR